VGCFENGISRCSLHFLCSIAIIDECVCVCVCEREREREREREQVLMLLLQVLGRALLLLESGLLCVCCLSKRPICEFFMHLLPYMRLLATRRSDVQSVSLSNQDGTEIEGFSVV
jgi:hypothetical protein